MARLIKAEFTPDQPPPLPRLGGRRLGGSRVIDREVSAAREQAQEIIRRAERRAETILVAAEERARLRVQEAAKKAVTACIERWERRFAALTQARQAVLERARPQVVELALAVAEKILHQRLESEPESIIPAFEEALSALSDHSFGELVMVVHPEDGPAVETLRSKLVERHPRWRAMKVASDENTQRGGCRIETEFGIIDASIDTQMAALRRALAVEEQ